MTNDLSQVLQDPQVLHRQMVVEMRDAAGEPVKMIGSPIKMSATPTVLRRFPPSLGEHTDEVAAEYGLAALMSGGKQSRAA